MEKIRNRVFVHGCVISGFVFACAMALIFSVVPHTALHAEESIVTITSADKDSGKITAFLNRPDSGSGPFPAVVIMHGGGGVHGWTNKFAATISGWGYVTLVIDSYGSRNIRDTPAIGRRTGALYQITDVYGGWRFLSKLDFVDAKNIAILGFFRGGHTALNAIGEQQSLPYYLKRGLAKSGDFAAAVAIYPNCIDQDGIVHKAPVLILIGNRDELYNLHCSANVVNRSKESGYKSACIFTAALPIRIFRNESEILAGNINMIPPPWLTPHSVPGRSSQNICGKYRSVARAANSESAAIVNRAGACTTGIVA